MNKPVYSDSSILDLSKTNVWILVWLCKIKIWWICKTLLYGYRQVKNKVDVDSHKEDKTEFVTITNQP